MILPKQAETLKPKTCLIVTNTGQAWFVDHVEMKGVLPYVYIWRGTDPDNIQHSEIAPERLHLFSIQEAFEPKSTEEKVSPFAKSSEMIKDDTGSLDFQTLRENLTEALTETKETATKDLTSDDAKHIKKRIEDYVTKEPELTKPARKPRKKRDE